MSKKFFINSVPKTDLLVLTLNTELFSFFIFFCGREHSWKTVQVQMREGKKKKRQKGGNGSGEEVWTFSSWLLPSLRGCQGKKAWLWIPHWDGLGPGGAPANLQPALLPGNSCSLHLPALHGGYLRKVCATPSFRERDRVALLWQRGASGSHKFTKKPCLVWKDVGEIHTDALKQRNTPGQQIALNAANEIVLIRAGYKQRHQSGQSLLGNRTLKHLFIYSQPFINTLCCSTDAEHMFRRQNAALPDGGKASGGWVWHSRNPIICDFLQAAGGEKTWAPLPVSMLCRAEAMQFVMT